MALGAGAGSGVAGSANPAATYNAQAGLSVSTSTIQANVKAGTNATASIDNQVINSTTPLINIQTGAATSPDSLGFSKAIQFEALVNTVGTGYPTATQAQNALVTVANYWGFANLAWADNNTQGVNVALLAW